MRYQPGPLPSLEITDDVRALARLLTVIRDLNQVLQDLADLKPGPHADLLREFGDLMQQKFSRLEGADMVDLYFVVQYLRVSPGSKLLDELTKPLATADPTTH